MVRFFFWLKVIIFSPLLRGRLNRLLAGESYPDRSQLDFRPIEVTGNEIDTQKKRPKNHHEVTELKRKKGRVGAGAGDRGDRRRKQTFKLSTGKEST